MITWRNLVNLQIFKTLTLKATGVLQQELQNGTMVVGTKMSGINAANSGVVRSLAAAATLTEADSGKTITLDSTTGFTITLPAVQAGLKLRFVMNAILATTNIVLDSAEGDNISGPMTVAGLIVAALDEDQINIVAAAAIVGDFVELESDGTSWLVHAVGTASGSITATDPS